MVAAEIRDGLPRAADPPSTSETVDSAGRIRCTRRRPLPSGCVGRDERRTHAVVVSEGGTRRGRNDGERDARRITSRSLGIHLRKTSRSTRARENAGRINGRCRSVSPDSDETARTRERPHGELKGRNQGLFPSSFYDICGSIRANALKSESCTRLTSVNVLIGCWFRTKV